MSDPETAYASALGRRLLLAAWDEIERLRDLCAALEAEIAERVATVRIVGLRGRFRVLHTAPDGAVVCYGGTPMHERTRAVAPERVRAVRG